LCAVAPLDAHVCVCVFVFVCVCVCCAGAQQAAINTAEGTRQSIIMEAAAKAEATELQARATAKAIKEIALAIGGENGNEAVTLRVAEQYIGAFSNLGLPFLTFLSVCLAVAVKTEQCTRGSVCVTVVRSENEYDNAAAFQRGRP
jgi:hypothetical protein